MKKVLITGVNSYVGNNLERWLLQTADEYKIEKISVRNDDWKKKDFSPYDTIVHVAGVAHVSRNPKLEELYYRVNRDLTINIAEKAKEEKVKQFIFLSSIIVYGENIDNNGIITKDTIPKPSNFYGNSKLEAEKGIETLQSKDFNVVIIRPPMIYGKDSKGNYPKLAKAARKLPLFPYLENKRSMLHIDNLCEFIKFMIDNNESGLFFPQNEEYVQTSDMVKIISEVHDKRIWLTKIFNPVLRLVRSRIGIINKVFGNLAYEEEMSSYHENYNIHTFKRSIAVTEQERS